MWENKAGKKQLLLEVAEDWKCETKNYCEKSVCSNVSQYAGRKQESVTHCVREFTRVCI
jgi:hypothetical protein